MGTVRLQTEPIIVDDILGVLDESATGGTAFYVGRVRERESDGRIVEALEYEVYPEMAQSELERLRVETIKRFGLVDAALIHRTGRVEAGQRIFAAACSALHRHEAFRALQFLVHQLKQRVPIWKQEHGPRGKQWIVGDSNTHQVNA